MAWGYIADKWQIVHGPQMIIWQPSTRYVALQMNKVWQYDLDVVNWLSWGLFSLEGPVSGLPRLHTANVPLSSPCRPVLTTRQHALLFGFIGICVCRNHRSYVNTSKPLCEGESHRNNFGSYLYYFSAWFFWLTM